MNKTTPDSIILEVCDSITKQWSVGSKQAYIKNIISKDSIRNDFYWDPESNKWINYQKVEFVYDNKSNEISQTYYSFDNPTNQWVLSSKSEDTYNNKGNKVWDTYYIWQTSSSKWVASVKTEFLYDHNGNNTLETLYIWGANFNKWIVSCKVENNYNATGNKILRVDYKFMQKSHDQSNHPSHWAGSEADCKSGLWEFICKYEYTYNEDNSLKSEKYYFWNPGIWENHSKSEYDYNHQLISHYYHHQWLYSINNWFLDNRSTYYYKKTR